MVPQRPASQGYGWECDVAFSLRRKLLVLGTEYKRPRSSRYSFPGPLRNVSLAVSSVRARLRPAIVHNKQSLYTQLALIFLLLSASEVCPYVR